MSAHDQAKPDLTDTPIMPTGSGVADLEIARELDALEDGVVPPGSETPTADNEATRESGAHPS